MGKYGREAPSVFVPVGGGEPGEGRSQATQG